MSFEPWFPQAGGFIKYYDPTEQRIKYMELIWKRDTFKYPYRFPAIAAEQKNINTFDFRDINPSDTKKHIYLAYLGLSPGFQYYLFHPVDTRTLKWDERIQDVNEDTVAQLTYEQSPYQYPTKFIGIMRDRYPGVAIMNISGETKSAQVIWIASVYTVNFHEQLTNDVITKLVNGTLRSHPVDFGGEV